MTGPTHDPRETRVCHVVYGRFPWDPRVRRETEALARHGYLVDVVCLQETGRPRVEDHAGIRVLRLPFIAVRGSRLRYVYQYALFFVLVSAFLARAARSYAIVHVHSLPDFLVFAALPARLLGRHAVLDLHESMPELYLARFNDRPRSLLYRITGIAQKLSCLFASAVVTVNPSIRRLLIDRGIPEARVAVVENAPDWAEHPSAGPEDPGIPHRVTIVGGLNPERDLETVIRAAAEVRPHLDVRWRIVGHGERGHRQRLEELSLALGMHDRISVESEVAYRAVPSLIAETTVGVVSYERNPLTEIATPNKAYEYALAGKPMVVADLRALRELLGDSVLYYSPGDPKDLAAQLVRLLPDAERRRGLAHLARERMEAHRWEVMEDRLRRLYYQLLRPHGSVVSEPASSASRSRESRGESR